jgi:hypothetical protein
MRRQRGSAMLLVVVFLSAITTVLVAAAGLSSNALKVQTRREEAAITQSAFDGAVDQVMCDYSAGTLSLPNTRNATIGGLTVAITVVDNNSVIPHTLKVDGTLSLNGRSYVYSRVVGARKTPSPFYYAVMTNSSTTLTFPLVTGAGSANGDVCINGSGTFILSGTTINGDLECTGTFTPGSLDIKGSLMTGLTAVPFPTPTRANYSAVATASLAGGSTVGNYTFAAAGAGMYKVLYVGGNATISGSFTGQGTVYVAGNVTISSNVTYGSAASCVAIIAEGSITVNSTATNLAGYYYCNGNFTTLGIPTKTVTRGGITCQQLVLSGGLNVQGDPWVWNTPSEGYRLRLPGMWP